MSAAVNQSSASSIDRLKEFGEPITKAGADDLCKKAYDIHNTFGKAIRDAIDNAVATPEEKADAAEYFLAPPAGFIFSYEAVHALYEKMANKDDSYLMVIEGAREKAQGSSIKGRRTVIAMVYDAKDSETIQLNTNLVTIPGFNVPNAIGSEHPGTKPPGSGSIEMELKVEDILPLTQMSF